jgi:selenocysteine lyase/cysteine desulfurase
MTMNRREAIRNLTYSAALFGLPPAALSADINALPSQVEYERDAELYWKRLRDEQFLMPGKRVFLQTGSLGVAARPVVDAVSNYLDKAAALDIAEGYPRWGYETLDEEREELAEYVGCKKDELAITHNATEAMSIIAGGMPLGPGAEVLITDQEHPSGREPWLLRESKGELSVRVVDIPLPAQSPAQISEIVISAIGPETRVLSFSGITSGVGLIMPIREICDAARARGVITVVDGAHMTGQVPLRISEMNCDYFAGSPHKWLFAPAGSGLLYIREERLDQHYPVIATAGWDDKSLKAGRFMRFGTNNRAIVKGFMAGLHFAKAIGPEKIYERIHDLAVDVYRHASELPYIEMISSADDRMYGSLVTFRVNLPDEKLARLWAACRERMIWTTENAHLRISTHVHTRKSDLDVFFSTLQEAAA